MNDRLTLAIKKVSTLNAKDPVITLGVLLNNLGPDYSFRIWRLPRCILGLSKSYRDNQHAKAIEKVIKDIQLEVDGQPLVDALRRLARVGLLSINDIT